MKTVCAQKNADTSFSTYRVNAVEMIHNMRLQVFFDPPTNFVSNQQKIKRA